MGSAYTNTCLSRRNSLAIPVAPSAASERKPKALDGGAPPNLSSPGTPSRASVSVRFLPDELVAQCAANHPGEVGDA